MYSLASAFVFANAVYAYRFLKGEGRFDWILFVLFGAASAYTHYFALVSVGIVYLILIISIIIKRKDFVMKWIAAVVFTIVLYLPWLKSFVEQLVYKVNNDYWIEDITIGTIKEYANSIFGVEGLRAIKFSFFFSLVYLAALIYTFIKKDKHVILFSCCLLSIPIGTILVGVAASLLIRPVFVIRYVVPSIPLLIAFMAYALGKMKNKLLIACILIVTLIGGISNYVVTFHKEYAITENALDVEFISRYDEVDCYIVLTKSGHISSVLAYYEPELPIYINDTISAANPYTNQAPINEFEESTNDTILMFLDIGEVPPEEYTLRYRYEYIGQRDECGNLTDVYLLVKDNNQESLIVAE